MWGATWQRCCNVAQAFNLQGDDMTGKTRKAPTPEKPKAATKGKAVASFPDPPDKLAADALAELALQPDAMAAVAVEPYTKAFGKLDVGSLAVVLSSQIKAVQGGEIKHAEAMLYGQAQALQAMFPCWPGARVHRTT